MSEQAAFERVLASLYAAMLDDTRWPATSALIDEACDLTGNALLVPEGPPDDIRVLFVGLYYRGQRRLDLEREYLDVYHPINEAIPRQLQLPAGQLVLIQDLYTAEELHTSRTYNEALRRYTYQRGLNVLLDGPGGSRMTWSLADPVWCNKEAEASLVAGRSAAHGPCREPPRRRCQAAGVPPRSRIGR